VLESRYKTTGTETQKDIFHIEERKSLKKENYKKKAQQWLKIYSIYIYRYMYILR